MKRVFGKLSKMRGSILAYTLILLGIVLTASLGMFMSSMRDLRSVGTQDRSMQAFQIANSGSEMAVSAIKKGPNTLTELATQMGASCVAGGEITKGVPPSNYLGGEVRLSFLDDAGNKITDCTASDTVSKIASVKSVGTFKETARAVEVAVAAGSGCSNPENAGKYVVVAKNDSSSAFTSSDWNAVSQFVLTYGGVITHFSCDLNTSNEYTASGLDVDAVVRKRTGVGSVTLTTLGGTDYGCLYEGFASNEVCIRNSGGFPQSCVEGWKIVGICPAS